MLNEPLVAAALIFALFALGEFISVISRARVPMLFVVMMGYLLLLWTGIFPQDIVDRASFTAFASLLPAVLIVHMGTIIPLQQLKEQYKAVLIALSGIVIAAILVMAICIPIIGYTSAIAGIGPLSGGIIAHVITVEKLTEMGLVGLVTIPSMVLALQKFIGMPLATYFLRKRGVTVQKEISQAGGVAASAAALEEEEAKKKTSGRKSLLPEKYQTQVILLFQVFLGAAIAVSLDSLTGINYSLWALALGLIGTHFGFYTGNIMQRANSFGISMALLIVVVMGSMNGITPGMFVGYLPEVLLIMSVGVVGIMLGGYFMSKLVKWDHNKGMPVALTALFGFPADYIVCDEVSRSVSSNETEQKAIFDELLTPMLVGGFTTVTIASIVIASILVGTL
ncbi:hypothetical protein [Lentibacillus sediminis]|uniref:hypothetical protein n=1 Tax=Lentibacillus sediminis TaxID=1940529 RepID=UPI000C1BCF39|nr:hypothetical protein [Lentibacillus sediminis]